MIVELTNEQVHTGLQERRQIERHVGSGDPSKILLYIKIEVILVISAEVALI